MRSDLSSSSLHKHNHVFVKFAVSFLLLGLAFSMLVSDSFRFSLVVEPPPRLVAREEAESPLISFPLQIPDSVDFRENNSQRVKNVAEKCDLFVGSWEEDLPGSVYTNESCHVIEDHQNCMRNGRPDSGYLNWRWKPRDCELPRFNPERFLDIVKNKSWAFIGDSISRNHVQSLICILSQLVHSWLVYLTAAEVYHDEEYRSKIWKFFSHNFTLSVIWSPFLIKAAICEDMKGVSSSEIQLYLDSLDNKWTDQYNNLDYVVIAGGKWFLKTATYHQNGTVSGCHNCAGKNLTELGFDYAYRKVLQLVFEFVTNSDHKATVFFRTTTPDHFENGEWFSGGYCIRTLPFKKGEIDMKDVDKTMRDIELEEFASSSSNQRVNLKLLDTTSLSLLRPDGHPGPYRQFHPFAEDNSKVQNDCLHWCLPGPIDSWNDLVMEILVNGR